MNAHRPRLQSLIFEVTQRCNHACPHCYNVWQGHGINGHTPYPRGELDTKKTIELLAKALDEVNCDHVTLTGGEPLLRSDLFQILEFLQKRRVHVTIISNGHLLQEKTVAELIRLGVGLFELPLLSHRREVHDELSASQGAWDSVLDALANIRLHKGQAVVAFVATKKNIADLRETFRLAFAFGARGVMFNRFNPGGRGRDHIEELLPSIEEIRRALEEAESASTKFNLAVSCSIPIQPCLVETDRYPHLNFGFCAAGGERAYYALDPLGNIRPCNHSDLMLGNLLEESFAEIIAPTRMADFIRAVPAFCAQCSRKDECQGGCKASAQVCYGSLNEEEPFLRMRAQT